MGVVELLHQPASVGQPDLDASDRLRAVHTDGSTGISFAGGLVLRASLWRHQLRSGAEGGLCEIRTVTFEKLSHMQIYKTYNDEAI